MPRQNLTAIFLPDPGVSARMSTEMSPPLDTIEQEDEKDHLG
jgi:hypothetical protein